MPVPAFNTVRPHVFALALCLGCASLAASLTGCTSFTPYKMEVVQGNFVSKEQVAALAPGMPREQVKSILGSPLLTSIFHADRWDYAFSIQRQGIAPQSRRVTVFFKGDALERFEADELPTEAEFVASLNAKQKNNKVPVLEATEAQLNAVSTPAQVQEPAKPLPPLPASYPALEAPAR